MLQKIILPSIYFFAISVFLVHFLIVGKAVYGDGRYYYAYLPSIVIDHSVNLSHAFKQVGADYFLTPKKLPANIYPIGSAIIWLIPFFFIHTILSIFKLNEGYNAFYQIIIGIWDITLVFVGLYFLNNSLQKFFSKSIALLSVSIIFFSTNLLFYGAVDVINSHSISFSLASLFFYFWLKEKTIKNALVQGVLLGFLALVRPQDALFVIFPLTSLFLERKKYLLQFFLMVLTAGIVFSPQLVMWNFLWGTWFVNPYLHVQTFHFFKPHILSVLFNLNSGLFLWTPITILAIVGLMPFTKRNKKIGIPMLLFFLGELYTIASWSIWWQGASYSGRMFISSLPLLAVGLGYLLSIEKYQKVFISISLFFCFLNPILIILFLASR